MSKDTLSPPTPSISVRVAASAIHGNGLFLNESIASGTRVIEYQGEPIDKSESRRRCEAGNEFIFYLNERFDLDGQVEWNLARWINHSCEPNCEVERLNARLWVVARRPLPAGTELTFDYGYDLDSFEEHPCHCGSDNCVGHIVAETLARWVRREESVET